jgi:hypothetical protein
MTWDNSSPRQSNWRLAAGSSSAQNLSAMTMYGPQTIVGRRSWRQRRGSTIIGLALLASFGMTGCSGEKQELSTPNQLLIEAQQLVAEGHNEQAMEKLNASIAGGPTIWALRTRARLLAERGDDQAALADCDAALQLAPDDADASWIKKELQKPLAQRFQGAFRDPPSRTR